MIASPAVRHDGHSVVGLCRWSALSGGLGRVYLDGPTAVDLFAFFGCFYLGASAGISSAYLLGISTPFYFYSAVGVLLLSFVFAVMAHFRNESTKDRPMHWHLNQHQKFNLEVLRNHLQTQAWPKDLRQEDIVKQIASHGWDQIVVELAVKDWKKAKSSSSK